ncbi:MAG: sigma-70 family RNA polymerase sigma factor, partial [Planctomycetota bacterium]
MPAAATADDEIVNVWKSFKALSKDSIEHEADYESLRNQLVERYMPLVRYNGDRIWQRLPDGVELDDLISAGIFGLMDAIDAYDMERGVKFETYCVPRIRGAMLDELRTMDWVPRLVRSKASKLADARKKLETKHGRAPTIHELAEFMELD